MKKLAILLLCAPLWVIAQNTTQNYTKKTVYREANSGRPASTVTYYDGLGRPVQQVANKQSATGKDIITHIEYDMGRQLKDYLPYAATTTDMSYQSNAQQATLNYAQYTGQYPFSEKVLEASPSARPLKQGSPGADWQIAPNNGTDHSIKFEYLTNTDTEVKYYYAATTWDAAQELYTIQLQDKGFYSSNQLYKTVTKDENWISGTNNTTEEFKNKNGQVVLRRSYNDGRYDTYYVYDLYGNLTYVIPPLANSPLNELDDLCYQYKYDHRNRLVEKKVPGKQWEFLVYDKLDRVVASGLSLSPFTDLQIGWLITKYDGLSRIAYTGWLSSTNSRKEIQNQFNSQQLFSETRLKPGVTNSIDSVTLGYTNLVFPTIGLKILTISYYDDYLFPNAPTVPLQIEGQSVSNSVVGLNTGSWIRIPTNSSEFIHEKGFVLYDLKSRPIRTYKSNHYQGYKQVDSKIDFMGKIEFTKTFHKRDSNTSNIITVLDNYNYDNQDRLLIHTQKVNGRDDELIGRFYYDEIGQLVSKKVGGLDTTGEVGLQKIDFRYNVRGWLTDINNADPGGVGFQLSQGALFGFKLNYNEVTISENGNLVSSITSVDGNVKPLYNGAISETFWKTNSDNSLRKYGYQYDHLNRLKKAFYQKPNSFNPIQGSYNESLEYDRNGNITKLIRTGNLDNPVFAIDIDELEYFYQGNKLLRVSDLTNNPEGFKDNGYGNTSDDFDYDVFGNLTRDQNKQITLIKYNQFNLPTEITFSSGAKINYLYNATGTRVKKILTQNGKSTVTDYLNGFQYENQILKFFAQPEGYVSVTSESFFNYVYNYCDHLGNVRVSWTWDDKNEGLKIIEENHYYPFGLKHKAYNTQQYVFTLPPDGTPGYNKPELAQENSKGGSTAYKYKFNDREWQDELGLNVTLMDYRQYDNAIGRFNSIDNLSEEFPDLTPYNYAFSNPVTFNDPTGLCPECPNPKNAKEGETYISTGGGNYSFTNGNWTRNDGDLAEVVISLAKTKPREVQRNYGGDGSGSFADISYRVADEINQFNPIAGLWDVISFTFTGEDRMGNKMSTVQASITAVSVTPFLKGMAAPLATSLGNAAEGIANVTKGAINTTKGLRNGHLAGSVHPKTGVMFDKAGFPDFSKNLYKEGVNDVIIKPTGNRAADFVAANKAAGLKSTPKGYTWHHHQSTGRMQLVEFEAHSKTGHTGGYSLWEF